MTWPSAATKVNIDQSTDDPKLARAEIADLVDQFNLLQAHVPSFMQTVLDDADAATARATLDALQDNVSATQRVLGRNTAGAGDVEEVTLTQLLDWIGSAAQGDILYRGSASWARLAAGTSGQMLQTNGAGADPSWADVTTGPTLGSEKDLSSGLPTTSDFTGLPSGLNRIEVMLDQISINNNNEEVYLQIGDSGGIETTGYFASAVYTNIVEHATTAYPLTRSMTNATVITGTVTLTRMAGNKWAINGNLMRDSTSELIHVSGIKELSAELDRVRLLVETGGNEFDGGSWNIAYQ